VYPRSTKRAPTISELTDAARLRRRFCCTIAFPWRVGVTSLHSRVSTVTRFATPYSGPGRLVRLSLRSGREVDCRQLNTGQQELRLRGDTKMPGCRQDSTSSSINNLR
jgi:hypothetical protein